MTDERRAELLQELKVQREESRYDIEAAHYLADLILCEVLTELGYEDFVEIWQDVWKWYS